MVIGTLKEIKDNENRVGLTPHGIKEIVAAGHEVIVEKGAGEGAGFMDEEYSEAGAKLIDTPEEVVRAIDMLVKVKEPLKEEYYLLDLFKDKTLFTYLHLSGVDRDLTNKLLENNITAIGYETVENGNGRLPLLAPMSEIAGVLAVQYGAEYLQKKYGGRGITVGDISKTEKARVVIVGGGHVGYTAAKTAGGMGVHVTIFDIKEEVVERLKADLQEYLGDNLYRRVEVLKSEPEVFAEKIKEADLLIGAVLVPGAKAPTVVSEEQIKSMKPGAVVVDVAIDQGGCIWGSKATSHSDPIYKIEDKIFCCVANMPGQVARQSTQALTSATLPYILKMANEGILPALTADARFARGLNIYKGKITYRSVAEDLEMMDVFEEVKL